MDSGTVHFQSHLDLQYVSLAIPSVARNRWHEPSHFLFGCRVALLDIGWNRTWYYGGFSYWTSIYRVFSHIVHDFPGYQSLILLAADAHLGDCRLQQGGPGSLWVIQGWFLRRSPKSINTYICYIWIYLDVYIDVHIRTHAFEIYEVGIISKRAERRIEECTHIYKYSLTCKVKHPYDTHVCPCFLLFRPLPTISSDV